MRRFLISIILVFSINKGNAQLPVAFYSEYIDFTIDTNYFSVNGIYSFRNKTSKSVSTNISFPFAVKSKQIDSIRIINMNNLKTLNYKNHEDNISFTIQILPFDTIVINIFYRQPVANKNSYILTTTKTWGAPLLDAVYTLSANNSIKIKSFSFEPDSSFFDKHNKIYFWHKQNFIPQTDFQVLIEK